MMINKERAADLFCRLVEIDSPSLGERQMADFVKAELASLGIACQEDDSADKLGGNAGHLMAKGKGNLPGLPLGFAAHTDTVAPACGKRAVRHANGRITSAGDTVLGADDLTGVAAILEAVRTIKENNLPHRDLELIFPAAEEPYCIGSRQMSPDSLQAKEIYVLDLSGPVGLAAVAAPTILAVEITVIGRASHAGFAPEEGIHAIQCAARALSRLEFGHVDPDTPVGIGVIAGGKASNIVPGECRLSGEIRSYSHTRVREELEKITRIFTEEAEKIGAEAVIHSEQRTKAFYTDEQSPIVRRFDRACRAEHISPGYIRTFGGSDGNTFAAWGRQVLVIANAMNEVHSTKEWTTAEEIGRIAALTLHLMTDAN